MGANTAYVRMWSAGEIVKRLHGVTARQILDLAEKGLVRPVRETTGAGSPRLYDFENIFEICICLMVRGRIPVGTDWEKLIAGIRLIISAEQRGKRDEPPCDVLLIVPDSTGFFAIIPYSYADEAKKMLEHAKKHRPQDYCSYVLEIRRLWDYLREVF